MNSIKKNQQKTLLQFWRSDSNIEQTLNDNNRNLNSSDANIGSKSKTSKTTIQTHSYNEDDDDIDDMFLVEASDKFMNDTYNKSLNDQTFSKDELTVGIDEATLANTQFVDCSGFDKNSGTIWIYPTNLPIREYQFHIVEQCLFKNTMVVLPTGWHFCFLFLVFLS
jgi:hypothetical protein